MHTMHSCRSITSGVWAPRVSSRKIYYLSPRQLSISDDKAHAGSDRIWISQVFWIWLAFLFLNVKRHVFLLVGMRLTRVSLKECHGHLRPTYLVARAKALFSTQSKFIVLSYRTTTVTMMKTVFSFLALVASASAFVPPQQAGRFSTTCMHLQLTQSRLQRNILQSSLGAL